MSLNIIGLIMWAGLLVYAIVKAFNKSKTWNSKDYRWLAGLYAIACFTIVLHQLVRMAEHA